MVADATAAVATAAIADDNDDVDRWNITSRREATSVPKLCLLAKKDQRDCTAEDLDYTTMNATTKKRPFASRSRIFVTFMTGNVNLTLTLIPTRIIPVVILERV